MLKPMILALLLAIGAPAAAAEQSGPTVAEYAAAMQDMVGQRFGDIFIVAITAERETLVILVDGPAGWRTDFPSAEVTAVFMNGFCKDADFDFFAGGKALRLDSLEAGADLRRGPLVEGCSERISAI